jgi:hypothetical protein
MERKLQLICVPRARALSWAGSILEFLVPSPKIPGWKAFPPGRSGQSAATAVLGLLFVELLLSPRIGPESIHYLMFLMCDSMGARLYQSRWGYAGLIRSHRGQLLYLPRSDLFGGLQRAVMTLQCSPDSPRI